MSAITIAVLTVHLTQIFVAAVLFTTLGPNSHERALRRARRRAYARLDARDAAR